MQVKCQHNIFQWSHSANQNYAVFRGKKSPRWPQNLIDRIKVLYWRIYLYANVCFSWWFCPVFCNALSLAEVNILLHCLFLWAVTNLWFKWSIYNSLRLLPYFMVIYFCVDCTFIASDISRAYCSLWSPWTISKQWACWGLSRFGNLSVGLMDYSPCSEHSASTRFMASSPLSI